MSHVVNNPLSESIYQPLENLKEFLNSNYKDTTQFFILVDDHTFEHCLPILLEKFRILEKANIIIVESGENNKTIKTCERIWNELAAHNTERQDTLFINLGGGVVCDLGGFAAATFKRGIDFINIPTTLISMADASIGGKTGVNFNSIKNMIGLFAHPKCVFIHHDFLKSLERRQIVSGMAEILKHGLIADRELWNKCINIMDIMTEDLSNIIYESLKIKQSIVVQDEMDIDIRNTLNFGHTIGHALESYSMIHDEMPITHGEAVASGMIMETFISNQMGILSDTNFQAIKTGILRYFMPYKMNTKGISELISLMANDKKNQRESINIQMLHAIGVLPQKSYHKKEIIYESLNNYLSLQH